LRSIFDRRRAKDLHAAEESDSKGDAQGGDEHTKKADADACFSLVPRDPHRRVDILELGLCQFSFPIVRVISRRWLSI